MVIKMVVQTVVWLGGMAALLFLSAGTLDWPGAWAFIIEMMILSFVGGSWLAWRDPALVQERLRLTIQKDQPTADKFLTSLLLLLLPAWLVFTALDAVRFGWSSVPAWAQGAGAVLTFVSICISYWTMYENSFAAPVVKIQRERGQTVISTGPYSYVRHPMYVSAILFFVGTSLLLGSWWGLAWVPVFTLLLSIRILIEEKTLQAGLQGYDEYAARVRYRLIPRVW